MIERSASLADLVDELETAADELVARTRRLTISQWRGVAGSDRSRGEAVHALVVTLAELEHAVAVGPATPPAAWRSPARPAYDGALADRLAVVASDLVASLRAVPLDHQVWYDGRLVPATEVVVAAITAVRATASHLNR